MKLKLHFPNVFAKIQRDKKSPPPRELYCRLCGLYERMCDAIMALSKVFVWSLYHDYEWPDIPHRALDVYLSLFDEDFGSTSGRYYVLDECYNIIHSGNPHQNLTLKYYAQKVYCFVNININFDSIWDSVSLKPKVDCSRRIDVEQNNSFDYYGAAVKLAVSIPINQRVDSEMMSSNLNQLYTFVEEQIKQYHPSILKKNLRADLLDSSCDRNTGVYNSSECVFLLKQIHDCIRHEFKFQSNDSSVYKGYKYCLDKVLKSRVGYHKLLVTLEAHLAQRYGVLFEIHEDRFAKWKIFYKTNDGKNGYYVCPHCNVALLDNSSITGNPVSAIITETLFHRSILESLVENFENRLKSEWELAGGPIVYNLLSEDTFSHSMRHVFSAWRHVEHWKIACLRHYTLLLMRVSDDPKLEGKLLHLNILLRVRSNQTLEALTYFRRELVSPPSGIRDLQRMVASVNIRARARFQELQAMLESQVTDKTFFLATFHPNQIRPWPHGYAGSDMVQKRRVDRKSWHVQFAVGQVVLRRRRVDYGTASNQLAARANKTSCSQRTRSKSGNRLVSDDDHSRVSNFVASDSKGGIEGSSGKCAGCSCSGASRKTESLSDGSSSSSAVTASSSSAHEDKVIPSGSSGNLSYDDRSDGKSRLVLCQETKEGGGIKDEETNKSCETCQQNSPDISQPKKVVVKENNDLKDGEDNDDFCREPPRKMDRIEVHTDGPRSAGLCVIFDWDSMCVESEETLMIMGETDLTCGTDQPFYKVLLDDGSSSYVAQENLQHTRNPKPINNPLLGRYFRAYERKYYIPNMQKAYEYPEDATIREQDSFILSLL